MFKNFYGKRIEDVAKHREDLSYYNHNYYEDDFGNMIYVVSDDDNHNSYFISTEGKNEYGEDIHIFHLFGESYENDDNIIRFCY